MGKGYRVYNHYGPTECTVDVSAGECREGQPVTIGQPIDGVRVSILNPNLEPQPHGIAGEIFVGGAGLARGYWGDAALTAELFVPDPLQPGERLFRTGDIGYRNDAGELVFLRRSDSFAKVHGVRINPVEIEQVLRGNPRVKDVAVVIYHNLVGEENLGLFVGGTDYTEQEIKDLLLQRLPLSFFQPKSSSWTSCRAKRAVRSIRLGSGRS